MHRLKNKGIVVLAVLGLFSLSGIAMADTEDDTVLNYGYDEENQFLIWNVSSLEYEPDTEALAEALEDGTTTQEEFEALLQECRLDGEGEDGITFDSYKYEDGEITLYNGVDPVEWPDGCNALNGGYVTGEDGQVNHGMFLKLVNETYDGPANRGCIIRHFAQSDLGKGDQEVEAEDDFQATDPEDIDAGSVEFTTVETNCTHGRPDGVGDEEGDEDAEGAGPPKHVVDRLGGDMPGKPADAGPSGERP